MIQRLMIAGMLALALTAPGCRCETHETVTRRQADLPDGRRVDVVKTDRYTQYTGVMYGRDYGVGHTYEYAFTISPGDIVWDGLSAEPKELLVCGRDLFLHYLDMAQKQSAEDSTEIVFSRVVVNRYARHQDDRYLFRLFGEQFWVNIDSLDYPLRGDGCSEHAVPNDDELTFPP